MTLANLYTMSSLLQSQPVVCHIISSFQPVVGGAEKTTFRLCRALISRQQRLVVLTRRQPSTRAFDVLEGVVVHRAGVPVGGKLGSLAFGLHSLWLLATQLREYRLLHVQNIDTPLIVALLGKLLFSCRIVATIHRQDNIAEKRNTWAGRCRLAALRRGVDAFVAISPELEFQLVTHGVESERVTAIPNGVDTNDLVPVADPERKVARALLGVADPGPPALLYVGRLVPHKEVDLLLRAVARIANAVRPGVIIVGDGPSRVASELLARRLDLSAVYWAGMQPDVAPYLRAADVFVLPSRKEGLSVALIEAMAMGLPSVVSDIPANRALVDDGQTGFVVPVGDEDALRERIMQLIADRHLRQELGEAARARIENRFSIDRVARLHAELYARVHSQRAGGSRLSGSAPA